MCDSTVDVCEEKSKLSNLSFAHMTIGSAAIVLINLVSKLQYLDLQGFGNNEAIKKHLIMTVEVLPHIYLIVGNLKTI